MSQSDDDMDLDDSSSEVIAPASELTPIPAQTAPPGINPSYWLPPPDALVRQRARSARGSRDPSTGSRQATGSRNAAVNHANEILESSPERARRLLEEAQALDFHSAPNANSSKAHGSNFAGQHVLGTSDMGYDHNTRMNMSPWRGQPQNPPPVVSLPELTALDKELQLAQVALRRRGLLISADWASELRLACIESMPYEVSSRVVVSETEEMVEFRNAPPILLHAKALFDAKEYRACYHCILTSGIVDHELTDETRVDDVHWQPAVFLMYYSIYLAGELRKSEELMEAEGADDPDAAKATVKNKDLEQAQRMMSVLYEDGQLDGLNMYLYSILLREIGLRWDARVALLRSLNEFPCNWSGWLDLLAWCCSEQSEDLDNRSDFRNPAVMWSTLVESSDECPTIPQHWIALFFEAAFHQEWQMTERALDIYQELRGYLPSSTFIVSKIALCHYDLRDFEKSEQIFKQVREMDPTRLEGLDTYSNLLYVNECSRELSLLARDVVRIEKYCPETACIVGNYYSLKGSHEKAITYFRRALALNRSTIELAIFMDKIQVLLPFGNKILIFDEFKFDLFK